jgi:hypothetical protein
MAKCGLEAERTCVKIRSKALINYFFNKTLASGNIAAISDQCICISTQYCIPINWSIKLLLPSKNSVFCLPVRVFRYFSSESIYHVMCAEIISPSREYQEYVSGFDKRACGRIPANLDTNVSIHDIDYSVFIKNISENGFNVIFTPYQKKTDFVPGTRYECQLQLPLEKTINLLCRARWSSDFFPYRHNTHTRMSGVEVINPPKLYNEFLSMFIA